MIPLDRFCFDPERPRAIGCWNYSDALTNLLSRPFMIRGEDDRTWVCASDGVRVVALAGKQAGLSFAPVMLERVVSRWMFDPISLGRARHVSHAKIDRWCTASPTPSGALVGFDYVGTVFGVAVDRRLVRGAAALAEADSILVEAGRPSEPVRFTASNWALVLMPLHSGAPAGINAPELIIDPKTQGTATNA